MKIIARREVIVDYNCLMNPGIYRSLAYGIERFAGGDHYRNFRNYMGVGGVEFFAGVVVVGTGSAQKPGETRLDLLKKNAKIVGGIAREVAARKSKGVMLIVSNPVDALTHVAIKESGWDRSRIIGSGTM